MDLTVLQNIPVRIDTDHLLQKLHLQGQDDCVQRFTRLADEARTIANPKALCKIAYLDAKGHDTVVIDGVTLTSRVLRVNLDQVHRVFPFVATCGAELEAWARSVDGILERFWTDVLMETVLRAALNGLNDHISLHHNPGPTSVMNPGSLADWPLDQQQQLFAILGDPAATIGVQLTDSFLMVPIKSVSGLRFPTEVHYENCQLCPRDPCPGRRAPYAPDLFESRYADPHA